MGVGQDLSLGKLKPLKCPGSGTYEPSPSTYDNRRRLTKLQWHSFGDVYPEGLFNPPQRVSEAPDSTLLGVLTYCQLQAALRAIHYTFLAAPPPLQALEALLNNSSLRKLITRRYTTMQHPAPIRIPHAGTVWAVDLATPVREEQ
ncbi:hypothetical protein NDU88_006938 [Pleurodeles waltl]|uniref:Uncharacterized protein n=1 Tax=Pleurodeles waltl TaxID=8319 RepID=A0AAV7TZ11_PLEWA|nr:hypothetical protein NDU88_006938 [Pleurodeles waltl]